MKFGTDFIVWNSIKENFYPGFYEIAYRNLFLKEFLVREIDFSSIILKKVRLMYPITIKKIKISLNCAKRHGAQIVMIILQVTNINKI